jgi:ferredoxin-NADP reductase
MSKSTTPSAAGAGVMSASEIPARLFYSARTCADLIYRAELADYDTTITLTREKPQGWSGRRGRIDRDLLAEAAWPPAKRPLVYLCGPTGFVEAVADALVSLGHEPSRIRAERLGPT